MCAAAGPGRGDPPLRHGPPGEQLPGQPEGSAGGAVAVAALEHCLWGPEPLVRAPFGHRLRRVRSRTGSGAEPRLVHAWRATFERDPRLPGALLPPDWPGFTATRLFVDTWRAVREPADRRWAHLAEDPRG
ncbi:PaaX family transcriptional regulator C-terminal domain-containing protein [Streptomyces sp. NPDC050844]|uniref:PaaX family transcriptional regulator C-terminal domain-containing protein n=1 Tax=Streptomyces sp. NPDC050844 TaxID=3155790 RepID=UPI0033F686D9